MNILIAIGGKEYSKPTLDLGMKIANSFEATTTIAYVGKKISQFSEKDVSVVHQNLDDRELYRPGVRTLEWAYDFLESKNYIKKKNSSKLVQFIDSSVMVVKNYSVNKKYKILLPVNNSLGSNKAIEIAQQFAKSKKMAVEIITVLENKSSDEELKSILKKTEKKFTNAGIKNTASILEGDPVQSVVKYAKDDCLVMLGVSPKNPILKYFFGSKPISIAQQCNCPVLIAK